MRFGKRGKLSPRYIGLFEILDRVGLVAYRLAPPPSMSNIYNVLHVSMLRNYMQDTSYILKHQDLQISPGISYEERPVKILDRKEKGLRNEVIPLVKV